MSNRDVLRSAILGSAVEFKKEIVSVGGQEYEIRQPSRKGRSEIFAKAKNEAGQLDGFEVLIWNVIYNTYVPGTDVKVFEDTDYDVLNSLPAGGIVDKLGEAASKLLGSDEDIEKK